MKKCPFCAEQIQEEAIKCRYCGSMLTDSALPSAQGSTSQPIDAELLPLIFSGRKIDAIKLARERMGIGLREAKDYVEAIEKGATNFGPGTPRSENVKSSGCLGILCVILLTGYCAYSAPSLLSRYRPDSFRSSPLTRTSAIMVPPRIGTGCNAYDSRPCLPTTVHPLAMPTAAPNMTSLRKWRLSTSLDVATYVAPASAGHEAR